jgi:hypothetical protein
VPVPPWIRREEPHFRDLSYGKPFHR